MAFAMVMMRSRAFWILLLASSACGVAWFDGYVRGRSAVQSEWMAEQARTAAGIVQKVQVQDDRNHVAAVRYEDKREQREQAFREIVRVVERVPAVDCGLSDDGLRQWNAANGGGTEPETASQSAGGVQDVAEGDERSAAGLGGESH